MSDPTDVTPQEEKPQAEQAPTSEAGTLEERVVEVLRTVFDPEIPVNIYELGLIYEVKADEAAGEVTVIMTLTTPACPVAGSLPGEVEMRIQELPEVEKATVELVWDPPWDMSKLSEEARLALGL